MRRPTAAEWTLVRERAQLAGLRRNLIEPGGVGDGLMRGAYHEAAGHAAVCMALSIDFRFAELQPDGDGVVWMGRRRLTAVPAPDRIPSLGDRISWDVGGLLGEHLGLLSVDAWGARNDLQRAYTRAHGDAGLVREQVQRLEQLFAPHQHALDELAQALLLERSLDRAELVDIARDAGWMVDIEPRLDAWTPPEERQRIDVEAILESPPVARMLARKLAEVDAMTLEGEGP
jgi:hypothetical protein